MKAPSIARALARFVCNLSYDDLQDGIKLRAKNLILDALGCGISGAEAECSRIALDLAKLNKGPCTILGSRTTAPAMDAAFANGVAVNARALDDFLYTFHPGTVNVPAALAIAEQEGATGKELITALVAGYEVMGRVYLGGPAIAPKFRATSVYGPFGSSAITGKLFKLDENRMTNALCHAANFASGLTQCWVSGTLEGYFHPGMSARDGMLAANLAKANASGAEETFEGDRGFYLAYAGTRENLSKMTEDLGKRFMIMEASFKGYPVCALQQIPVDLILRLRNEHDIIPNRIKEIVERVPYWDAKFPGGDYAGPFENVIQSTLSSQFCAAAALLGKPVQSFAFYSENYGNAEIAKLAQKVKVVGEEGREFPLITLTLDDGKTYSIEADENIQTLVPTKEKIETKFMELTSGSLGRKKATQVIKLIASLEEIENIREVTKLLR
jgi:2-methylcitrate dehydratase PrpD